VPQIVHSTDGANLADVLERILDKGVVIAGDIRIKLVEVELLTINIRLLISSVDKAREIGIDWWSHSSFLCSQPRTELPAPQPQVMEAELQELRSRLERLERSS
jgi:Gas vesicle protein